MSHKYIHNAIIMFKYRNSYAIATNSFGNSKFVIKFAHNKNLKDKLIICQVYKSKALVDNKHFCVMQIPNMPWKFVVPTYLLSKSKFCNELGVFANWITYLNIMNALQMHLCDLQIWHRLPCSTDWSYWVTEVHVEQRWCLCGIKDPKCIPSENTNISYPDTH